MLNQLFRLFLWAKLFLSQDVFHKCLKRTVHKNYIVWFTSVKYLQKYNKNYFSLEMHKTLIVFCVVCLALVAGQFGRFRRRCPPNFPNNCPPVAPWDQNLCRCVCSESTCVSGEWSTDVCGCITPCTKVCTGGYTLDEDLCFCRCDIECGEQEVIDYSTCTCLQVCSDTTCVFPHVLDVHSCGCKCHNEGSCGEGQRLDRSTCLCQDICPGTVCPAGKVLDYHSCGCKCEEKLNCDRRGGEFWNPFSCACEEKCAGVTCADGERMNGKCQCIPQFDCSRVQCQPGMVVNQFCRCRCEEQSCSPPTQWNPNSCACV